MAKIEKFTPNKPKIPEVKKENVVFMEVEVNDDYRFADLTPEQQAELIEKNNAFEANTIQPLLLDRAAPCQCQMEKIVERVKTKMRLGVIQPGPNGQIPMELTQDDVDTRQFGIVVTSNNGVYTGVNMVISKCKGCGDIHFYGDIEAITRMCANAYGLEIEIAAEREACGIEDAIAQTMVRDDSAKDDDPAFVLENTETGERTGADDLGAALFGAKKFDTVTIRTEPVESAEE